MPVGCAFWRPWQSKMLVLNGRDRVTSIGSVTSLGVPLGRTTNIGRRGILEERLGWMGLIGRRRRIARGRIGRKGVVLWHVLLKSLSRMSAGRRQLSIVLRLLSMSIRSHTSHMNAVGVQSGSINFSGRWPTDGMVEAFGNTMRNSMRATQSHARAGVKSRRRRAVQKMRLRRSNVGP